MGMSFDAVCHHAFCIGLFLQNFTYPACLLTQISPYKE